MKDSDIEHILRKYRPIAPSADLRDRIFLTSTIQRIWPWAGSAAALLVFWGTLGLGVRYEIVNGYVRLGPSATVRAREDLTELLGGGIGASELANFILVEQRLRTEVINRLAIRPNDRVDEETP